MKAKDVKEPGFYWYENPYGTWCVVEADLIFGRFFFTKTGSDYEEDGNDMKGEFLGPIQPAVVRF